DDQSSRERAREIYQPPDEHGGETTRSSQNNLAEPGTPAVRTDSETREAEDDVPDLPASTHSQHTRHSDDGSRDKQQRVDRGDDSTTWSERDWVDSECESDLDFGGSPPDKSQSS